MKGLVEKHMLPATFKGRLPESLRTRRKQPFLAPFGTPVVPDV